MEHQYKFDERIYIARSVRCSYGIPFVILFLMNHKSDSGSSRCHRDEKDSFHPYG